MVSSGDCSVSNVMDSASRYFNFQRLNEVNIHSWYDCVSVHYEASAGECRVQFLVLTLCVSG